MTEALGNLVKVKIRTRWPNEAADFTPWLALEEKRIVISDFMEFLKAYGF